MISGQEALRLLLPRVAPGIEERSERIRLRQVVTRDDISDASRGGRMVSESMSVIVQAPIPSDAFGIAPHGLEPSQDGTALASKRCCNASIKPGVA
jgi:hypothetical protein